MQRQPECGRPASGQPGSGEPERGPPVRLALPAMGTRFELVLAGADPVHLRAVGEAALQAIAECEAAVSPFVRGSMIARVNAAAHERPVRVDPATFELLAACRDLHLASGGAFDPTVGPLLAALGFRGAPPADAMGLAAARARVGMQHVELDPEALTVRLLRPGMALDLGAVGKGHALDLAGCVLRAHGVRCALLHGGTSSVLAIGAPPGLSGWRIGIGPFAPRPVATLCDVALAVSAGHGQRRRQADGTCAAHLVDPRAGLPVTSGPLLVAVVAASARAADAWSTALLVDGTAPPPAGLGCLRATVAAGGVRWNSAGETAACFCVPDGVPSATQSPATQSPATPP
jgi:thiamine biosynthesis lipoprotein